MLEMTKKQKRHLKELSSRCYEIEVSNALNDLGEEFNKWKNKEITIWDLNDRIHKYHNGTARDLYKIYEFMRDPRGAVARAISKGIIRIEDVQENCRPLLESLVKFYDNG